MSLVLPLAAPAAPAVGEPGQLAARVVVRHDHTELVVTGELDLATGPALAAFVEREGCAAPVVLDLAGLTFADVAGLRCLVTIVRGLDGGHDGLVLRGASPFLLRVMTLAGVDEALGIAAAPG